MGIDGHIKVEELLHQLFPEAFSAIVKDDFVAQTILIDLTASMRAAFSSRNSETGMDLACHVLRRVQWHCSATRGEPAAAGLAENGDSATFEFYRKNSPRTFLCPITNDATIVLAMDDAAYTPSIRSLLHKKRYKRTAPLTAEDFESEASGVGSAFVFGERKLPGAGCHNDPKRLSQVRLRSYCTPAVRSAVAAYVPWTVTSIAAAHWPRGACCQAHAVEDRAAPGIRRQMDVHRRILQSDELINKCMRRVERQGDEYDATAQAYIDEAMQVLEGNETVPEGPRIQDLPARCNLLQAPSRRTLIVDSVPDKFDCKQYVAKPLHEADASQWLSGKRVRVSVELETGRIMKTEPVPAIGECDVKFAYYIDSLTAASAGSDVIVETADSDILWALLLNAHRFQHVGRLILDANTPNMAKSRYGRRFVDILALRRGIVEYASRAWGVRDEMKAVIALAGMVMTLGGDYTTRPPKVGPPKVIDVIEERMRQLSVDSTVHVDARDGILVAAFTADFALQATAELYVQCARKDVRGAIIAAGEAQRTNFGYVMRNLQASNCAHMKNAGAAVAHWRRVAWNINYYMNAHLGIGCTPSPAVNVKYTSSQPQTSVTTLWGWARCEGDGSSSCELSENVIADVNLLTGIAHEEIRTRKTLSRGACRKELKSLNLPL